MKRIILLFLLIPLFLRGQENLNLTDPNGLKQGRWEKRFPNGRIMYEGSFKNNKPVGEWKRWQDNGDLKAILDYSETTDTVRAKLYDAGPELIAEGAYRGERKEGLWKYYSKGNKIAEEHFIHGLKSGGCRKFYTTGELLEESEWVNNRKEGKYQAFFQSGKPYLQCTYKNGQRNGRCFSYFPSGMPEVESYYISDSPDGTWKYLDENGGTRFILLYEKGTLKNPEVLIDMDTRELENLEKQREHLTDPEKYLQNPEEYLNRKK